MDLTCNDYDQTDCWPRSLHAIIVAGAMPIITANCIPPIVYFPHCRNTIFHKSKVTFFTHHCLTEVYDHFYLDIPKGYVIY